MSQHFAPPRNDPKESQIQRLEKKTGCDPVLCQEALVESQGSLLSALLHLEEKGLVPPPDHPNGGCFSTKDSWAERNAPPLVAEEADWEGPGFLTALKHEILDNKFEIWRRQGRICEIPVVFLVLLFPLTYGSLVFLLLLPLFFGIYYRFSLEGSFLSEFNPIVKRISMSLWKFTTFFHRTKGKSSQRKEESK